MDPAALSGMPARVPLSLNPSLSTTYEPPGQIPQFEYKFYHPAFLLAQQLHPPHQEQPYSQQQQQQQFSSYARVPSPVAGSDTGHESQLSLLATAARDAGSIDSVQHLSPSEDDGQGDLYPGSAVRDDCEDGHVTRSVDEPPKKKQTRNKPTLSCFECVDRKTKCDRGRPHCLACIKRQTDCKYAYVANILEETTRSAANGRKMTRPPKQKPSSLKSPIPNVADRGFTNIRNSTLGSLTMSKGLLSDLPYSSGSSSSLFGVGGDHPFANLWTCIGGLHEVIPIIPPKEESDVFLNQYFKTVDPVYPMIHSQTFYAEYAHFWSQPEADREHTDPAWAALLCVMLALGNQMTTSYREDVKSWKFRSSVLASAANQAFCISKYLSTASIRSIQAMVLIAYYLINDDHASDGWAFAGIMMRQAMAMSLHRDPNIVTPDAPMFEKQQRRKVWQAVLVQDTFFAVLLSLPPTCTHTDVNVEDMVVDDTSIANDDPNDMAYIRGSWMLANLVQESICSPRSLDLPICATARQKSKLVADFRGVYRSFPDVFRAWDKNGGGAGAGAGAGATTGNSASTNTGALASGSSSAASPSTSGGASVSSRMVGVAGGDPRIARQMLFLSSNYFHNLMLVHASEGAEVSANVRGTLDAAHDAITAFFLMFELFEAEARLWWTFNHRAFLEALCMGSILRNVAREPKGAELLAKDILYVRARADIHRMVEIMEAMSKGDLASETARTRVQVLRELL